MTKKRIPIGADHAGFVLKEVVVEHLKNQGYEVEDFGTHSPDSVDYPDFAHSVAQLVEEQDQMVGILICGSGNGMNMVANKYQGIRSALSWTKEISELARRHNNANILVLPARFISEKEALAMVDAFLSTEFEGERHEQRVQKISRE